ncbi:hypothetical protein [Microbacterium sp. Leaf151]|uniref:hypothetical protein n=1 Tax=Microbacterium sp. Leaf151 TaxID=1736276 RepID=UPI0006F41A22|nr:hypothetical protein [Microbacterium sp. Leaf151]KQR25883.1 hypothetical protein ASF76_00920 [Microbacterium sp. Leaf151]
MVASVMALSVTCLIATGTLLLVGLLLVGRDGSTGTSLQYAALAGVAEVSASAIYLVWVNVGGSTAFAVANALMVLGPVMIPLAFHSLGPTRVTLWSTLVAAAGVVVVAATSFLLPVREAVVAQAFTFAIVGVCGAAAALGSREAHRTSIRVLAGTLCAYALYCATRGIAIAVAVVRDDESVPGGVFSDTGAIAVGVVVILLVTGAISAFWLADRRENLLAAAGSSVVLVIVPGRRLGDTGRLPRFRELVEDVREAAAAIDSGAVAVFGGAGLSRIGAATALKDTLRIDHGWTEEEIALLTQTAVER